MTSSRVVAAVLALLQAVSVNALCEDFFCYETVTTSGTCESATNGRCTTMSSADCDAAEPRAVCRNLCKCPGTRTKTPTQLSAPASAVRGRRLCEGGDACKETACSGCYQYCDLSGNYGQLSQGKGTCTSQVPDTVWYLDCNGCSGGSSGDHFSFIYQGFYLGDYLYVPYYTLIIIGVYTLIGTIGTIVVCGLSTDREPPCWAKFFFPLCAVGRFDSSNCGSLFMACCFGCWFTMFCWTPPQRQPMYQSASGAPQVQMMSVVPPAKPPASSNSVFEVEVPQGATPGSSFTVQVGNQVMTVSVPIGSLPGSKIQISAPAPQVTAVAVPAVAVTSVNVV